MIAMFGRMRDAISGIGPTEWALIVFEALGIVASILIAFALDDWATARREQAQVDRLLVRMQGEARRAVKLLNVRSIDSYDLYKEALPAALALSAGQCPADLGMIDRVDGFREYDRPSLVTFDELKNRVGLSSIPDELRSEVTATSYQLDYMDGAMALEDRRMSALVPMDDPRRHTAMDTGRSTSMEATSSTFVDPGAWAPITRPRFDREALCRDQAFRERFIGMTERLHVTTLYRNDTLITMIRLCERLSDYTRQPCFDAWLQERVGPTRRAELDRMMQAVRAVRR